ncbi:hypothetical protein RclHR1_00280036 [Rhizophagus clarus]|uniref:Uncharacterized protein n=1 Tax=Rhizophagus clarus TaxID=94130 RepID=A0A2Z6RF53_9GLOM|nr:hypothetical protein RclHR1_00280036 [Rhizophagus clarus]
MYGPVIGPDDQSGSSDIGHVTLNNPGAIYKSRLLSVMFNSAMSIRSSRIQPVNLEKAKRKFDDNSGNGQSKVLKEKNY